MAIDLDSPSDDQPFAFDDDEKSGTDLDVSESDSGILVKQPIDPDLLRFTRDGHTTIIGFHADHLHDDVCLAAYRERVLQLIEDPTCKRFLFDLSNVKILPSGMLGLMASLKKRGFQVDLLNASPDVQDVLQVMKMGSVFGLHETLRDAN